MRAGRSASYAALILLAGCGPSVDPGGPLTELSESPTYAVISSDYLSSAVGLLNDEGQLVEANWLDSGSAPPGLATTLSGDVTLPTTPALLGEVALIDRLGVDIITRIRVPSGEVVGQHHTSLRGSNISAFRPNPHDVVYLDSAHMLVSRSEPNIGPSAARLNLGNDVIRMNLENGDIVDRIDLSDLNSRVDGETIYARPNRMVTRGALVLVALARLSLDFMRSGVGAIAILHTDESMPMTALELSEASGCAEIRAIPGTEDAALVTCSGPSFVDEEARRGGAGLFLVRADGQSLDIELEYRSATSPDHLGVWGSAIPIDEGSAVVIGRDRDGAEAYYYIDLRTGDHRLIYAGSAPFTLGIGTYTQRELLIPDAGRGVVARLQFEAGGDFHVLEPIDLRVGHDLPPREIRRVQP